MCVLYRLACILQYAWSAACGDQQCTISVELTQQHDSIPAAAATDSHLWLVAARVFSCMCIMGVAWHLSRLFSCIGVLQSCLGISPSVGVWQETASAKALCGVGSCRICLHGH
jgi:hypothetical protein